MHVQKVLDLLQRVNLCANMSKCEFGKTSLVYLGFVVGGGQLKVEFILNYPKPRTITKVRSVLGEVQYWRTFIVNFSYIASPLHEFTSVK